MREILFKAKRKNWRELPKGDWWVEGYFAVVPRGESIINVIERKCDNPPDCDPMWGKVLITYEVAPETVCQYTGLTDKKGKKIFEGDIVESKEDGCYGTIDWNEYVARFYFSVCSGNGAFEQDLGDYIDSLEVIGNIFDNHEILQDETR